ncbi:RNA polymerase sigma factor for flagellar operon FliA [Caldalkalibacillus uzonensis]|uniref:RNA polymerase sigma factor for flagellar operon FliA n=1 Tax=Caldalkalibacillus uzonensis TaxID=353224 RepID=A0ABU0CLJ4_9BACI|nr:FliA/WhiG family RNA polymerase sigma factor [Caldalkalibacillus uzonensis]MDQ0337288.1 RNA polymerase sigma factor for flagellar operon FliA [Caldalkalibacillus uzonensis]
MSTKKWTKQDWENWRKWKDGRDPEAGQCLVLKYMSVVDYVVGRISLTLPDSITKDELKSWGLDGLLDAFDKFEPERGLQFETYARLRVKGAIIDELRRSDILPRSVREKARKIEEAYLQLEQEKQRSVTDQEVSQYLGISVHELRQTLADVSLSAMLSIDEVVYDEETQQMVRSTVLENSQADNPEQYVDEQWKKETLAHAIDRLPEKEKWVVSLAYFEELTLTEIAQLLNLSTSRISQLHSKALLRLKAALSKEQELICNP